MKTLFYCIILLLYQSSYGQNSLDSLWSVWQNKNVSDSLRLNAFSTFAYEKLELGHSDEALKFSKFLYSSARVKNSPIHMAMALNLQGTIACYNSEYDKSLKLYQEAKELNQNAEFENGLAVNVSNIALVYTYTGEYDKASENYFEALSIFEEGDDYKQLSQTYDNLAQIYFHQFHFDLSVEYYLKSLKLREESGTELECGISFLNLGSVYENWNNIEKRNYYYDKARTIFETENFKRGLPFFISTKVPFLLKKAAGVRRLNFSRNLKTYSLS